MPLPNCDKDGYPQLGRRRQSFTQEEADELDKEVARLARYHESSSQQFGDYEKQITAQRAKLTSATDLKYHKQLGELETLKPGNSNRVGEMLATQFNQKANHLALNPNEYSREGKVWYQEQQMRRIAHGLVEAKARWEGTFAVRDAVREIKAAFGKRPISRDYLNEVVQRAIEVGQIPERRASFAVGEAGDAFNMARHHAFVDDLRAQGLSQSQVDRIITAAGKIQSNADEARMVASAFNPRLMESPQGVEAWARIFTPDAQRFMQKLRETEATHQQLEAFRANPQESSLPTLQEIVAKDRNTYHYIPESEALLSYQLGIPPNELRAQILDGQQFIETLKRLPADQLDNLVDNGSLSKIPFTTPELYKYLVTQFGDLPFKGMKEMFISDPETVFEKYRESLARDAGRSAQLTNFYSEGVKAGWVVDADTWKQNPDAYRRYVPSGVVQQTIRSFPPDHFANPTAFRMLKAQIEISKSPAMLGSMASTWQIVGRDFLGAVKFLNKSLLIDPVYPLRIFHANFVAAASAGANLLRIPEGFGDLSQVSSKGLEALDDTKKVYEVSPGVMVSKRELFRDYFVPNRSSDILPQTHVVKTGRMAISALDPRNLPRALDQLKAYAHLYGGAHAADYLGEMLQNYQAELGAPIASFAMYNENAMKWATLLSISDSRASSRVGQFLTTLSNAPRFDNWERTLKHVDDYFHTWDDVGNVTKLTSDYVRPFAQFAMNNPMMQIRAALRRPTAFTNYWRVRQIINQRASQDPNLNESDVPEYMRDSGALYLFKIDGQWVALPTEGSDPIFEGYNFLRNMGEDTTHEITGAYTGDAHKQYQQVQDTLTKKSEGQKFFEYLIKSTMPAYQEAYSAFTNKDAKSERPIEHGLGTPDQSFLGGSLSPSVVHLLKTYGITSKLDANNPINMFGTPEIKDPRTGHVIQPGTPSIFGVPRHENNSPDGYGATMGTSSSNENLQQYNQSNDRDWRLKVLRLSGFKPQIMDYAKNMKYSYSDMQYVQRQAKEAIGRATRNLHNPEVSEDQKVKIRQDLDVANDALAGINLDMARAKAYMDKNHVPPSQVFERMRNANPRNLTLTPEQIKRVQDEGAEIRRKAGIQISGEVDKSVSSGRQSSAPAPAPGNSLSTSSDAPSNETPPTTQPTVSIPNRELVDGS